MLISRRLRQRTPLGSWGPPALLQRQRRIGVLAARTGPAGAHSSRAQLPPGTQLRARAEGSNWRTLTLSSGAALVGAVLPVRTRRPLRRPLGGYRRKLWRESRWSLLLLLLLGS